MEAPITRICNLLSFGAALVLTTSPSWAAVEPIDQYWQALRADLSGQPDEAVKQFGKLITQVPASSVAADRLLEAAMQTGDFKNALKAARAQKLANQADPDSPLLFFVESWNRGDWVGAKAAVADLKERQNFAFLEPILTTWIDVVQGKTGRINNGHDAR